MSSSLNVLKAWASFGYRRVRVLREVYRWFALRWSLRIRLTFECEFATLIRDVFSGMLRSKTIRLWSNSRSTHRRRGKSVPAAHHCRSAQFQAITRTEKKETLRGAEGKFSSHREVNRLWRRERRKLRFYTITRRFAIGPRSHMPLSAVTRTFSCFALGTDRRRDGSE
jgi:hypothetical protein